MAVTILGTSNGQEVGIELVDRNQGCYVIGASGTGKTTLIERMAEQDIAAGIGICVIDPHGDLIKAVINITPIERINDVVLLNPMDMKAFPLNIYACSDPTNRELVDDTVNQVMEVYNKIFGVDRENPLTIQVLRHTAITIIENGLSIAEIPELIFNDAFRARLVANVTNPETKYFWRMYESLKPDEKRLWSGTAFRRVDEFLSTLFLRAIVGQLETINFREMMDTKKIVLVKLPGKLKAPTSLLGATIIGQIYLAALSREDMPEKKRNFFSLYVDEFSRYSTATMADMFFEGRKYGILSVLAHQSRDQLDDANKAATLSCRSKVVFAVGSDDAEELSGEFDTTPGEIEKTTPRDIFRYLPHHKSDSVKWFYHNYIKRWQQAVGEQEKTRRETEYGSDVFGPTSYDVEIAEYPEAILDPRSEKITKFRPLALRKILHDLEEYLYCCLHNRPPLEMVKERFEEYEDEVPVLDIREPRLKEILLFLAPYLEFQYYLARVYEVLENEDITRFTSVPIDQTRFQKERIHYQFFLYHFTSCVLELCNDPIQIEIAGSTHQTHADKQKEIENMLSNKFGRGDAMVKTPRGQWRIRTKERKPIQQDFQKKWDMIVKNTRENYCRDRDEIEKEIAARIRLDDLPPTQRKHKLE